eukprot:scaffold6880_cov110-Isochrysis_galbana.AAC.12
MRAARDAAHAGRGMFLPPLGLGGCRRKDLSPPQPPPPRRRRSRLATCAASAPASSASCAAKRRPSLERAACEPTSLPPAVRDCATGSR